MRQIAVVLVDRANYGRLKPVMQEIKRRENLSLQVICGGSMVLRRFHRPVDMVRADGFEVKLEICHEVEGSTPETLAISTGHGLAAYAAELARLKPDLTLVIGDRYEALAAAAAAALSNRCLVHFQGGEVSGSIDESIRHAITKLAHYHVPATHRAADYLMAMGEDPRTILAIGCPSSDLAARVQAQTILWDGAPEVLAAYHPQTSHYGGEVTEMQEFLRGLAREPRKTLLFWPNIDPGSDRMMLEIRRFRQEGKTETWLQVKTNLPPGEYLAMLAGCRVAVGNSSSFVRDSGYSGCPVVLVGDRQEGREHGPNVLQCACDARNITAAIRRQLAAGRYPPSNLYGDGQVSKRVVDVLETCPIYLQKRLDYGVVRRL